MLREKLIYLSTGAWKPLEIIILAVALRLPPSQRSVYIEGFIECWRSSLPAKPPPSPAQILRARQAAAARWEGRKVRPQPPVDMDATT